MIKRLAFSALFVVALFGMVPSEASAQCDWGAYGQNRAINGILSGFGSTTPNPCATSTALATEWKIEGFEDTCDEGVSKNTGNGRCTRTVEGGTNNALAGSYVAGCGTATGLRWHYYRDEYNNWYILNGGNPFITLISAGCPDPEEECNEYNGYWDSELGQYVCYSPILIPRKGASVKLTSAAAGVSFDITGDGVPEQIGWTAADSDVSFLAYDRNGNGTIDNGTELFGNHTLPGVSNGFAALAALSGAVAKIDSDNPFFARLLLWTDRNHNGVSEASELERADGPLSAIGLAYKLVGRKDQFGNKFTMQGFAFIRTKPGKNDIYEPGVPYNEIPRRLPVYDVYFTKQ